LTAFSQKDTKSTIDSTILLPKIVAIQVVKDIIRMDSCTAELTNIKSSYQLLQSNNNFKDSIIQLKSAEIEFFKQKEKNYEAMLTLKDIEKNNMVQLATNVNKKLVKTQIGASAIILFLLYVIVK